ncbi:MAG TPA: serine hydrolase [Trueperaceae bacterium]
MDEILDNLRQLERKLGGTLGLYATPLLTVPGRPDGDVLRYNESERFPAASTIKVFVLLTLLEQVDKDEASLDEEVTLTEADQVTGSGVLKSLSAGRAYTLLDLATLMIIVSDNTATNLVIDRVGVGEVNDTCRRHGWNGTELAGKLQTGAGHTRSSMTCPRDLADYFVRLWRGDLLPPRLTAVAQAIFRKQQLTDQLGRELDFDSYSTETGESRLTIASKSGSLRGVRNDAGVIEAADSAYVVAIMTKGCPDERFHPDNLGSRIVSSVSRLVFDRYARSLSAG